MAKTYEENLYWKITVNNTLKKLLEQAGTDSSGKWMSIDNAEKFAELLIRECIDILMEPRYIMDKSQKLSRYNEGWVNGRLLGIEHIEKHFGVESWKLKL